MKRTENFNENFRNKNYDWRQLIKPITPLSKFKRRYQIFKQKNLIREDQLKKRFLPRLLFHTNETRIFLIPNNLVEPAMNSKNSNSL